MGITKKIKTVYRVFTKGKEFVNLDFEELYDKCKPHVLGRLKYYFPQADKEDIQDAFQEAIMKLYENLENGKLTTLTSSIEFYLFIIARNKMLDFSRKPMNKIGNVVRIDNYSPGKFERAGMEEMKACRKELEQEVLDICYKMQEPCGSIFVMRFMDGMKWAEIFELMKQHKSVKNLEMKYKVCIEKARIIVNKNLNIYED